MYLPKFSYEKNNLKTVRKYDSEIIFSIIILFIKYGVSNRNIDYLLLNLNGPGYESDRILKYFGITENHHKFFENTKTENIIELLSSEAQPNQVLIEILKKYDDKFEGLSIKNSEIAINDVLSNEDEAYINAQMKIRNRTIQSNLRSKLLIEFKNKCCMCDINLSDLLVASHIIPYSQCNSKIELISNPNNALLLCVLHDKLFESSNHISFNIDKLVVDEDLFCNKLAEYKLDKRMIISREFLNIERVIFLQEHLRVYNRKHSKLLK